jgi:predicted acetylornithine/succinylornithine family transaminase
LSQQINNEPGAALLKNYARYDVTFAYGGGSYLYDKNDKQYLDFLSGIAVTSFGHAHPLITSTVMKQVNKFWHTSNLFKSPLQEELADKLAKKSGLDYAFFCNTGTEANEGAIKFARKWGNGRYEIISTNGSFHGRTMGSLSATGQPKFWEGFGPLTPGFNFVPYNNVEAIANAINENTVAVLLEPIQGESGIIVPDAGYLQSVRALCDKHNLLLIIDEVQAGIGRTGKYFAYQWDNVLPDIVTLAKGIANGIPLGAVLCKKAIGDLMTPGTHGSTFGGNPLAVSAANVLMDLLDEEMLGKILELGKKLTAAILEIGDSRIKEIRGKGLLIGVEFYPSIDAKAFAKKLLENGLVVGTSSATVLRLLPPFIISDVEIQKFAKIFKETLSAIPA